MWGHFLMMITSFQMLENIGWALFLSVWLYSFPRAAVTKYCTFGSLKQQTYPLTVLEAGCPKSECWQGHALFKVSRGISFLTFFFPPSFWCVLVILGVPWPIDVSFQSLPVITWHFPHMSLCPIFSLFVRTCYWILNLITFSKTLFSSRFTLYIFPGLLSHFSRVRLLATLWIGVLQAPLFMGFCRW